MNDRTHSIPDFVYKDDTPGQTVARIRNILAQYGIETRERWNDMAVPNCYSVRVTVPGTTFGTNGKGVTEEFALASGYGEFMERLQLGHIAKEAQQKGGGTGLEQTQSHRTAISKLLEENGLWYQSFARQLKQFTGAEMTPEQILRQHCDENGTVETTSFYNITADRWEELPTAIRKSLYTTNGCAAGNSPEEAIVQAISEIVERHFKLRVLAEKAVLPEFSREVLKSCPIAWDSITFMERQGFRVSVKDCSLGSKFPVICVCIIDCKTGRYHTHFGAFPNFEIALQRTLTESFQGRNTETLCTHEGFTDDDSDIFSLPNLMNEMVKGTAERRAEFFALSSGEVSEIPTGFSGRNNRELLQECIAFFREQNLDILVRDCSCLGFPTYQVIIPGYSEIFPHRLSLKHNDLRYADYAMKALRDPAAAGLDELMGLLMHLAERTKKKIPGAGGFLETARLPAELTPAQNAFYMDAALAHSNYTLGRYGETLRYLNKLISAKTDRDEEYLVCLKRYLTLQAQQYAPDELRAVLEYFHKAETVKALYLALEEKKNPLDPVILRCDKQCLPTCKLSQACRYHQTGQLKALILEKTDQIDRNALPDYLHRMTAQ